MAELICDTIDRLKKDNARLTRELAEAQGVVDGKISSLVTEMAEIKAKYDGVMTATELENHLKDMMRYLCQDCIERLKKVAEFRIALDKQHRN